MQEAPSNMADVATTSASSGSSTTDSSMVPAGVLFPRERAGVDSMQAYGGGELVLDEQRCLRLGRGGDIIV